MRTFTAHPALLASAAALWCAAPSAEAQITGLDTRLIASGLNQPVFATAPLADGRVFVVEKGGLIKVVQAGVTSTFLSVPVANGAVANSGWLKPLATSRVSSVCALAVAVAPARASKTDAARVAVKVRW